MAAAVESSTMPAPTLQRLLAIKQSTEGNLDDYIRQTAQIIGLPSDWDTLLGEARSAACGKIVLARADYVLRFVLEKLKDVAENSSQARASPLAWKLLDCMIHILPISRCAPTLRDSNFITILERTLQESFSADVFSQSTPSIQQKRSRDASDSSETVQGDSQPSRKRKRGTSGTNTPSKRIAVESTGPAKLFDALMMVLRSIRHKAEAQATSEGLAQAEHMKMVLKTESAQAARILKYWLNAVQRLTLAHVNPAAYKQLDLSDVIDIWELRIIDPKDSSGSSGEEFSTECLVPALLLSQTLQATPKPSDQTEAPTAVRNAIFSLDKLVARHVLTPARAAFLDSLTLAKGSTDESDSSSLENTLAPLRARYLQAAQIEDSGEPIPASFLSLFAAAPQLLDLAIRASPARSRKARVSERPWIQAAFVALAACIGCALEAPEFKTPRASIEALKECLQVLASNDVSIDADVLKDLFWFHAGFKYPLQQEMRSIQWSLVASIIELDSDIFLADPRSTWNKAEDKPDDLASYLFEQVSAASFEQSSAAGEDRMEIDGQDDLPSTATAGFTKDDVVETIIAPIISAFARNRDLLGFISRWDDQMKNKKATGRSISIWQDRKISEALATHFEQSLTPSQILTLVREHAKRLKSHAKSKKGSSNEASSSATIVQAILLSVTSDEVIETLKPQLLSLWSSYTTWIQSEDSTAGNLGTAWSALTQLLLLLWPIHFHASSDHQKGQLYPLVEQASKDIGSAQKKGDRDLDSNSRAATITFLLTACDCLRSATDAKEFAQKRLRKALKSFSLEQLEIQELRRMLEILCSGHVQILDMFEPDICQTLFSTLMSIVSQIEPEGNGAIAGALAQSVFTHGKSSLQTAYTAALLDALAKGDEKLNAATASSLLHIYPSSISREQREAILDRATAKLTSSSRDAGPLLSIMVQLMEISNATAKISSDGTALFNLAQALHDTKQETPSSLGLFQRLVQSTLMHILPNKEQAQNKQFLEAYKAQLASAAKRARTCFPARLSLLNATFLASQKDDLLTMDQHLAFLISCLKDQPVSDEHILKAFNDIPLQALKSRGESFSTAQAALQKWVTPKISSTGSLSSLDIPTFASLPADVWPVLHGAVARYHLCANDNDFIKFSSSLLRQDLPAEQKASILASFKDAFLLLDASEKLAVLPLYTPATDDEDSVIPCQILRTLVSTMDDKLETDSALKQQQHALLPRICLLLEESTSDVVFNSLIDTIVIILREKTFLTTQHGIECVLAALTKLTSRHSPRLSANRAPAIFTRLCETSRLVLLLHRKRMNGRFHLLLPLLQGLLLCLFIPNAGRGAALPPWLDSLSISEPVRLTSVNASAYTRLLTTLCSPTQSSVQRHNKNQTSNKKELNDPVKAARDYASQYIYPLLSSFCRFQLYGRMEPEVREKLMPGIWEVVGVGSLDRSSLDAMFEGMGKSEMDVWRGVWKEWEDINGRREFEREAA